jgi:hypothetical protein
MSDDLSAPNSPAPRDEGPAAVFAPYIQATGEVVDAWNRLHETLKYLFVAVTKMPENIGYAVWHSARSDSVQREMLRAAIDATGDKEPWVVRLPTAKDDLKAFLKKANKIGETRNDAIHAPVSLAKSNGRLVIVPFYFNGNPRAENLRNKDILTEFNRCRDEAYMLNAFADHAEAAIKFPSRAWPDKPSLLIQPEKKKGRDSARQIRQGEHQPPPQSSPT